MSNSNNHQIFACQFAEQIVSYLYGEDAAGERVRFEAHLKNCLACADELAGFGAARASILEWRDTDFAPLDVPQLAIPATAKKIVAIDSGSWFDRIRKMFAFKPALAATALAMAVVGVGVALFALNFSPGNETAAVTENKNVSTQPIVSPTVEITKKIEEDNDKSPTRKSAPPSSETVASPKETRPDKPTAPEKAVVKVSTNAAKNNSTDTAIAPREAIDKKPSPVKKQRIPNLNVADEDEDETIRLADLFDELDTK